MSCVMAIIGYLSNRTDHLNARGNSMKDQSKIKQVLIQEQASLRKRISELEQSESEHKQMEKKLLQERTSLKQRISDLERSESECREMEEKLLFERTSLKQKISDLERLESERKEVEEELHESEEKYQNILENIEDCYFEVDRAGDFTFFNPSFCRILGYTREEMLGMNYRVLMDAENAKKIFRVFNEVYVTGIPAKGVEWEVIRKDGARMYIEVSISLIVRPGEKATRFRAIARDITERKRMKE